MRFLIISLLLCGCVIARPHNESVKMYVTKILACDTSSYSMPVVVTTSPSKFEVEDITITDLYYFDGNKAEGLDTDNNTWVITKYSLSSGLYSYELEMAMAIKS